MSLLTFALLCSPSARAQGSGGYPGGSGSGGSGGYPGGSGGSGWVAQPAVVNGVTYPAVVTGTINSTFTDFQGNVTQGSGKYYNYGSSPPPLSVNAGESLTYAVDGKVVYTWKWDGGPNNTPPPSVQYVHEWATASASGGGDINGTVTVTAGTGGVGKEKSVSSVSDDGKSQSKAAGSGGEQWVRQDGSSGTITVTGTVQAECDLSEPKSSGGYPGGGYPGGGSGGYPGGSGTLYGNAGTYYQADLRDHCEISSPIETSYYKGAYDSQHGTSRYLHQRNPDGSIQVDAGVTWQTAGAISPEGWGVTQFPFTASSPFDNPSFSWSAGGPGWIDGQAVQQQILYTMGTSLGSFPAATHFQATVTAPDGTTDQNTYDVTWHLPYEKNEYLGAKKTKHSLQTRVEGVEPDFPAILVDSKPNVFSFSAAIDGLAIFVPEGAVAKGLAELVGKIAEMSGWEYEYGGEGQSSEFTNNSQNYADAVKEQNQFDYVGNEPNFPASLGTDPSNYFYCKMAVKVMEHDTDKSWYADGYNINGFDGNSVHVVSSHVIDNVYSERFFTPSRSKQGGAP
jgi:hypothetical protein